MNKSPISFVSIFGLLASVIFVWIFLFSIWYTNNILNEEKFVSTTTAVLNKESVRNAISNEIVSTVQQRRPIVGLVTAPLLEKVIAGVMNTDVFANVTTRVAQQIRLQLVSANPREITLEIKPTKDFLSPVIERTNPDLMKNIPDRIPVIKKNQIPSLYEFGTFLTVGGPILLIAALIIMGIIWIKTADKRMYFIIVSLCFAATALLVYYLIPAIGNYAIAQTDSANIATVINEIYTTFTTPISQFAFNIIILGVVVALVAKFVRREIFRFPQRDSSSKAK